MPPERIEHPLSISDNPTFRDLVELLLDEKRDVVLYCGAGLSMDAGVPSWPALISRLRSRIKDPVERAVLGQGLSDLPRSAERVLLATEAPKGGAQAFETRIAEALYETATSSVGQLPVAVARLAVALGDRARVITTNFDDILERAVDGESPDGTLGAEPMGLREDPSVLSQKSSWRSDSTLRVLHVHGYVRSGYSARKTPATIEPLILTESDFISHAAKVQAHLEVAMDGAVVLVVGSGLSDPNLVSVLMGLKARDPRTRSQRERFVLLAPDMREADRVFAALQDGDASAERDAVGKIGVRQFAERSIKSLGKWSESRLGARPIYLKTYGQVSQALKESTTATRMGADYVQASSDGAVRYGGRLKRIVLEVHKNLGVESGCRAPGGAAARLLSDSLEDVLQSAFLSKLQVLDSGYTEEVNEKWGLFLWLKPWPTAEGLRLPYQVFQAGSSAYSWRDSSVIQRKIEINEMSGYAAALAIASGVFQQIKDKREDFGRPLGNPWRSFLAMPLTLGLDDIGVEPASPALATDDARVTVGAWVLHSTLVQEDDEDRAKEIGAEISAFSRGGQAPEKLSLLNELNAEVRALVANQRRLTSGG